MEIRFQSKNNSTPKLSIVLIDWSCRESFHTLDYLSKQTVERQNFEIIWIEYYDKRPREIDLAIRKSRLFVTHPPVDKWIVLDMPRKQYYHKHLMYNVGIIASAGEIVTICDSDAMVAETFVSSIINSFEKDRGIVLHMDQVRNREKSFYPFNYPSFEEVMTTGRTNLVGGKPAGLSEMNDSLHTRNYGACMSALRDDLLAIGGADEHVDYLGYVCGPYDMTWRLVNMGRTEVWLDNEWTYHVWHPGQLGAGNYFGPHDGLHVSTTALTARQTGRVLPLVENPAIRELRVSRTHQARKACHPELAVLGRDFTKWSISNTRLEMVGTGKALLRKCLPRPVKTYVWSSFRRLRRRRKVDGLNISDS
jgi:hypothetical protein